MDKFKLIPVFYNLGRLKTVIELGRMNKRTKKKIESVLATLESDLNSLKRNEK